MLEFALTLPQGGYVTGRIVDPLGQPVGGVSVRADAKDQRDTVYTWPQTTSDTNGVFLLGPGRPISYSIIPSPARNYYQRWEDATRTAIVSDGCTNALGDIKLSQEEVGAARRRK